MSNKPLTFGELLRRHRLAAELTQEELAEQAGISARGVSDLERGVRTRPQRETINLLITALGLTGGERASFLRAARQTTRGPGRRTLDAAFPDAPLPHTGTHLLDRDESTVALIDLLADPATRLITLLGTAGIGKTRLAIAVADGARDGQRLADR